VVDINLLIFKDGEWVYRSADQPGLVDECAALLNWDLYAFDRWLFDSQNWSMYTRRRQDLIAVRTELALAYGNASDQTTRELLIVTYCMLAWKSTCALERRECPEVQDLEFANARAKAVYKTLKIASSSRKTLQRRIEISGSRRLLSAMAYGL
jgi:hypothetical protein